MENLIASLILFVLIFGLNVIPVFAPPTWMALAFVGFGFPEANAAVITFLGAAAATLGRLTLAKLSHRVLRDKILGGAHRGNIDEIRLRLQTHETLTTGVFFFYAFSPLPSNLLFIAYGLTALPLWRIALPFFLGRSASYGFFVATSATAGRRLDIDWADSTVYVTSWFIVSQLAVIGALLIFAHLDWGVLFREHKLAWIGRSAAFEPSEAQPKKPHPDSTPETPTRCRMDGR